MIGATILTGVFIGLGILALSLSISFGVCVLLDEMLEFLKRFLNLKKVFLLCVFLGMSHFLYTGIADYVLMIFE